MGLGMLLLHLVCRGGAALLLLAGGGGLLSVGLVRGSVFLLVLGFVVVAVGLFWRSGRRRREARAEQSRVARP